MALAWRRARRAHGSHLAMFFCSNHLAPSHSNASYGTAQRLLLPRCSERMLHRLMWPVLCREYLSLPPLTSELAVTIRASRLAKSCSMAAETARTATSSVSESNERRTNSSPMFGVNDALAWVGLDGNLDMTMPGAQSFLNTASYTIRRSVEIQTSCYLCRTRRSRPIQTSIQRRRLPTPG